MRAVTVDEGPEGSDRPMALLKADITPSWSMAILSKLFAHVLLCNPMIRYMIIRSCSCQPDAPLCALSTQAKKTPLTNQHHSTATSWPSAGPSCCHSCHIAASTPDEHLDLRVHRQHSAAQNSESRYGKQTHSGVSISRKAKHVVIVSRDRNIINPTLLAPEIDGSKM